ncbi:glycerophosphodiester phosphodiesterase family protein [Ruminococcus sp. HUN007]|uniref:glycerophosphodiester phosphodiesterase family protein n=1 Tax=Ruminococcus sp. HUN007 TaxID=1514668 RepID=UPI000679C4A2|nr:glycerophosphodiester phosphodiesterase family protein [Ruminococcus sp. HUN007]
MKKTCGYFFRLIKDNFISLAAFEFIFKASAFILFVPLIARLMNIATNNAGIMFITTKNVARLMKNPLMIVMTLSMILILICISYYEVCCIWMCYRKYARGIRPSVSDMFADGLVHLSKTSRRYGIKIYLQMAAIFPLLCFHMTVILFDRLDILASCVKFIFRGIPVKYIGAISAVAVIFLFSFSTQKFGRSISGRREEMKHFFRRTVHLIAVNLITGLALFLIYLTIVVIAALVIRFFGKKNSALVYLIRTENIMYYVLAFLAGAFGYISNIALLFMFQSKHRTSGKPLVRQPKGLRRKIVTVLIIIVFVADIGSAAGYVVNGSHVLEEIFISTTVTAHRGGAKFVPENTMYGVEYAIESGSDYIEIDVQLSADGEVFLLHDTSLKRTTGANKPAYTLTYEELSRLDAGSFFNSSFSDAYIPTLDEVLTACKSKINLNIEIKSSKRGDELVTKVLELIDRHEMREQCVITSTEYPYLKLVKELRPEIRTGYISNMLYGDPTSLKYADFFSVKFAVVNENFVKAAHNAGKEVHVWTVNTKPLINRMKGLDVDSIITDNPVLARKILARKNDRKSLAEILQTFLYR